MRSLALYITYALYEPENVHLGSSRRNTGVSGTASPARRKTISTPTPGDATPTDIGDTGHRKLNRVDVAIGMLKLYDELLDRRSNKVNIERFARAVTNKVSLTFCCVLEY